MQRCAKSAGEELGQSETAGALWGLCAECETRVQCKVAVPGQGCSVGHGQLCSTGCLGLPGELCRVPG